MHFFLLQQKPELENQQSQQMSALPWFFPSVRPLTLTHEQLMLTVCELAAMDFLSFWVKPPISGRESITCASLPLEELED